MGRAYIKRAIHKEKGGKNMATLQVKVGSEVIFSESLEEIMSMIWDSFEELENVDPATTTIEVV